jgi:hypothetical protein
MDSNPMGDKANHTQAIPAATTDPIYQSSLESDSEHGREVYMVGNERNSWRRWERRSNTRLVRKSLMQSV